MRRCVRRELVTLILFSLFALSGMFCDNALTRAVNHLFTAVKASVVLPTAANSSERKEESAVRGAWHVRSDG